MGKNVTAGNTPVPVSGSICGLLELSSVMLTAAVRMPVEEGVRVTVMLQPPPAGTDVPQLLVSAKSPLFGPVTLIDVIVRVASLMFVRIDSCGALVIPKVWLPKLRLRGTSAGAMEILAIKTSLLPPLAGCKGFMVGKSIEVVFPVTYAFPELSTAMP